jgi:hypothetical protein
VCAARERIIQSDNVTGRDLNFFESGGNGHGHRSEVHGHVIALRYHASFSIEDCTRVIAALFDVWREGSPPECDSHLLSHRSEERTIDLERRWIEFMFHNP